MTTINKESRDSLRISHRHDVVAMGAAPTVDICPPTGAASVGDIWPQETGAATLEETLPQASVGAADPEEMLPQGMGAGLLIIPKSEKWVTLGAGLCVIPKPENCITHDHHDALAAAMQSAPRAGAGCILGFAIAGILGKGRDKTNNRMSGLPTMPSQHSYDVMTKSAIQTATGILHSADNRKAGIVATMPYFGDFGKAGIPAKARGAVSHYTQADVVASLATTDPYGVVANGSVDSGNLAENHKVGGLSKKMQMHVFTKTPAPRRAAVLLNIGKSAETHTDNAWGILDNAGEIISNSGCIISNHRGRPGPGAWTTALAVPVLTGA